MLSNWGSNSNLRRQLSHDDALFLLRDLEKAIIATGDNDLIDKFLLSKAQGGRQIGTPAYQRWYAHYVRTMQQKHPGWTPKKPVPAISEEPEVAQPQKELPSMSPEERLQVVKQYLRAQAHQEAKGPEGSEGIEEKEVRGMKPSKEFMHKLEQEKKVSQKMERRKGVVKERREKELEKYAKGDVYFEGMPLTEDKKETIELVMKLQKNPSDSEAWERISNKNSAFLHGIVWKVSPEVGTHEDLYHDAQTTFYEAITKYVPTKDAGRFFPFVKATIEGTLRKKIRKEKSVIDRSFYRDQLYAVTARAMGTIKSSTGKIPTTSEVASYINENKMFPYHVSPKMVASPFNEAYGTISSEADPEEERNDDYELSERIKQPGAYLENPLDSAIINAAVEQELLGRLTDAERWLYDLRSGDKGKVFTWEECAEILPQLNVYFPAQIKEFQRTGKITPLTPNGLRTGEWARIKLKFNDLAEKVADDTIDEVPSAEFEFKPLDASKVESYFQDIIGRSMLNMPPRAQSAMFIYGLKHGRLGTEPEESNLKVSKILAQKGFMTKGQVSDLNKTHVELIDNKEVARRYDIAKKKLKVELERDLQSSDEFVRQLANEALESGLIDRKGTGTASKPESTPGADLNKAVSGYSQRERNWKPLLSALKKHLDSLD